MLTDRWHRIRVKLIGSLTYRSLYAQRFTDGFGGINILCPSRLRVFTVVFPGKINE